ncbi:acyl-CoA N-acyltransferase [Hypoxylon trugodes]|uniref:acyl-CoA N-acyltransferase n=1 Tax=Hypoxylon trugodes TaxID=326681 RepID=UPI0021A1CB02|nr:acyl-CoA N-acyltransferase [Hypoxylon trugodes]KAI1383882.1 acyl-CoA N-acyltransferase [Hypoxylon trugodes]
MSIEHQGAKVKTTLPTRPFPPNAEREHIRTERLIIRPFTEDDLDGIYSLRTQPEVMIFTMVGRIDADKEATRAYLSRFLPPNDLKTYNNVICLASTGELIGCGGAPSDSTNGWPTFGWPEIGYIFKLEHWGKGYATEFLRAWLDQWWSLPRSEVEVKVDAQSVDGSGEVPEMVMAVIEAHNKSSRRVLEKAGFQEFRRWVDTEEKNGIPEDVDHIGFALSSTSGTGQKG